jgi:hypothetical protein
MKIDWTQQITVHSQAELDAIRLNPRFTCYCLDQPTDIIGELYGMAVRVPKELA